MNSGGGLQGFRVRGIRTAGGGREEGDCLMWIDILPEEVAGANFSKHKTDISRPGPKVPIRRSPAEGRVLPHRDRQKPEPHSRRHAQVGRQVWDAERQKGEGEKARGPDVRSERICGITCPAVPT
jgi:hypothetical protein